MYKALGTDGRSCNGGSGKWSLPILQPDGTYQPGRWMPRIADIEPCKRGYHLFEREDILQWVNETLYEAEGRGAVINHGDKVVYESARLLRPIPGCNERTLRLFACRVAEDVLPFFEAQYPGDDRPRKAIEVARRFAEDDSTGPELAAARAAAWAAASAAAWDATWDAARAAAGDAAWTAAWTAAWAATGDATWDAAWTAAWAATWDATWDAAGAAAGAAAGDAARAAAAAAACDAAWENYTDWLWEMLRGSDEH